MSFETNLILDEDSYKFSHWLQYPPETEMVFSYIESRGGEYPKTVFFGLQYILEKYLSKPITLEDIQEVEEFCKEHGVPFNKEGWLKVLDKYNGYLPLKIKAVPEGSIVSTHNILVSVENTDKDMFWLTSVVETMMVRLWYPITVATISKHCKDIIYQALEKTCDNPDQEIPFKLHDFGSRGVSSRESAAIGGAAHLVNFLGSDTAVGVMCANKYYNEKMSAYSIPAAEHSTITSWGRENEAKAYRNMLSNFAKEGSIVAVVSDSYNIYNACENIWGEELKQEVIDSGATVVIRPDSGNPIEVVSKVITILGNKFGYTVNSKGYKVLNYVRIIQGDGVNPVSIQAILDSVTGLGYSAENLAFGMGGALLQGHNRDTLKFAMKCSYIKTKDKEIDVYKEPITDPGKNSKRGLLDLVIENGKYKTVQLKDKKLDSELVTVFENGKILKKYSLSEVREKANKENINK